MQTQKVDTSLGDYLTMEAADGKVEFRLVWNDASKRFYIHPLGKDGDTLDYECDGLVVRCVTEKAIDA